MSVSRTNGRIALTVLAIAVMTPQFAIAAGASIRFQANLPFADCRINGERVVALLDTGSFRSVQVSSSYASRLGLSLADTARQSTRYGSSAKTIKTGTVASFEFAGIQRNQQAVDVIDGDIEAIARQVGVPFDAILGWGFLGQRPFRLDYAAGRIDFDVPAGDSAGAMTLRYELINNVPVVTATINAATVKLLFDTGAPICNVDPSLSDDPHVQANVTGTILDLPCRLKDLTALRQPTGASAVIGNNVLERYVVFSDPTRRVIVLVPRG